MECKDQASNHRPFDLAIVRSKVLQLHYRAPCGIDSSHIDLAPSRASQNTH